MPTSPLNLEDPIVISHENRLSKVESEIYDTSNKLAALTVTTEYIKKQVDTGFDSLSNQINNCVGGVSKRLDEHLGKSQNIWDEVARLDELHKEESAKNQNKLMKRIAAKKGAWALFVVAFGVLIAEVARLLMKGF